MMASTNPKTSMLQYSSGYDFPWMQLQQDLDNDAFDVLNYDTRHALNWINRHFTNRKPVSKSHSLYEEMLAASNAWCCIYLDSSTEIQAQLRVMLQSSSSSYKNWVSEEPQHWCSTLEKVWLQQEDVRLWEILYTLLPQQIQAMPVTCTTLINALRLAKPQTLNLIKPGEATFKASNMSPQLSLLFSDIMYTTLARLSESDLKIRLSIFQLL